MRSPCLYLLHHTILNYAILYYTILYYTILYYTILYYTILYYTILYYTILYYTILYYTILYHTIPYHTIPYHTILYYTILYYTILYYTILYYTILYYTILYYTILYYTILYYTILYYTILYYTILYYTIIYHTIYHLGIPMVIWPCGPLTLDPLCRTSRAAAECIRFEAAPAAAFVMAAPKPAEHLRSTGPDLEGSCYYMVGTWVSKGFLYPYFGVYICTIRILGPFGRYSTITQRVHVFLQGILGPQNWLLYGYFGA